MSWVDDHEPDEEEVSRALDDLYGEMRGVRVNTTRPRRRKPLGHERKGKKGRVSPVKDYVRSLGEDYHVVSEVASALTEQLGFNVSTQLVRKLASQRVTQAPSFVAPFGQTHVNLYTTDDIKALKEYLENNRKIYKRDEYPHKGE